jgi:hypothetical protein
MFSLTYYENAGSWDWRRASHSPNIHRLFGRFSRRTVEDLFQGNEQGDQDPEPILQNWREVQDIGFDPRVRGCGRVCDIKPKLPSNKWTQPRRTSIASRPHARQRNDKHFHGDLPTTGRGCRQVRTARNARAGPAIESSPPIGHFSESLRRAV